MSLALPDFLYISYLIHINYQRARLTFSGTGAVEASSSFAAAVKKDRSIISAYRDSEHEEDAFHKRAFHKRMHLTT